MKPADIRRLRRVVKLSTKLSDALIETDARGLTDSWRAFGDLRLSHLLAEFAGWYERRIELAERAPT